MEEQNKLGLLSLPLAAVSAKHFAFCFARCPAQSVTAEIRRSVDVNPFFSGTSLLSLLV